jgi:uncharacterized membrane protein YeiH
LDGAGDCHVDLVGLILFAVTGAMLALARPKDGNAAAFLKLWIVGEIYILAALVSAVMGITIVLTSRPLLFSMPVGQRGARAFLTG